MMLYFKDNNITNPHYISRPVFQNFKVVPLLQYFSNSGACPLAGRGGAPGGGVWSFNGIWHAGRVPLL